MGPVWSKAFLDIQANAECGFTLKRVRGMIKTDSLIKRSMLALNYEKIQIT